MRGSDIHERGDEREPTRPPWRWGKHRPPPHPWQRPHGIRGKRRFIAGRFFFSFGCASIVFIGALAALALWLARSSDFVSLRIALPFILCGLPFLFMLLMAGAGTRFYQELGKPLSQVMAAADEVADGNLDVRVPEDGRGEVLGLSRSFNRMVDELDHAEQQRRNLTADVAHELRTPLHILQGNLEGLQDGVYQPTPEHIDAMLDETHILSRLVDDLQTLSLAEAGQLPLDAVSLNICEFLEDICTSFDAAARAAGVGLELDLDALPAGTQVLADPGRLDQVMGNLLSNALRHTPSGGTVILQTLLVNLEAAIRVVDSGSGIPAEDLPYVFDRFWRGDRARTRTAGTGSGLGLAIARQLIEAQDGRITVESPPGEGAIFTVWLPIA